MIQDRYLECDQERCKPRASGDDPVTASNIEAIDDVNPARAGMIPTVPETG